MTDRPDHARELRYSLTNPRELCERLGICGARGTFKTQPRGIIVRCPWHKENTPSCSVRIAEDGTIAVRCHGCGQSGDALSLVAAVYGLSLREDFPDVLRAAADIAARWDIREEIDGKKPIEHRPAPPAPAPEPERDFPSRAEVLALWEGAGHVSGDVDALAWAKGRGLSALRIDGAEVARVVKASAELPRWARYQGSSWTATGHRLLVPMVDPEGDIRSVRGCRIIDGDSPKRLPPGGHKASALIMACPIAVAMLRGTFKPARVVVSEGEPDFMLWASKTGIAATARIGIVSGSWTMAFANKFEPGVEVIVRTDPDDAGDRYANEIGPTLQRRGCHVRREPRKAEAA